MRQQIEVARSAAIGSSQPSQPDASWGSMAVRPSRICIVTNLALSHNPRVVKEADALHEAGFDVRVVSSQNLHWVSAWDEELIARKPWRVEIVRWSTATLRERWVRYRTYLRQALFERILLTTRVGLSAELAFCRLF